MKEPYEILNGDCLDVLRTLPDKLVQTCITSPPYFGLRDYGVDGQVGLESTPEEYVARMVEIFREVRRVLRDDGTLWLNLGDSYAGSGKGPAGNLGAKHNERHMEHKHSAIIPMGLKPKDLIGIPWRVALALQADGWYLRSDIIWHKRNPMPESVKDRPTKAHEYIFLLSKSAKYYYDAEAIKEPANYDGRKDTMMKGSGKYEDGGFLPANNAQTFHERGHERWQRGKNGEYLRNKRDVWTVNTKPYPEAHFAVYPPELIEPCVLAGCPEGGTVLDPFCGSGTTGEVAIKHDRIFLGIELNAEYIELAEKRIEQAIRIREAEKMQMDLGI